MTKDNEATPLPIVKQEARERWINAACLGDLTSDELAEKLGIDAREAQAIVDANLRETIKEIVKNKPDRTR